MPNLKLILPENQSLDNSFEGDEESCQRLLTNTSNLLAAVGISAKRISSIKELHRAASSMFVAIFETIFRIRLKGITRNPRSKLAYAQNAQIVIDGLSDQIQMDLHHIRGKAILDGDMTALSNLVNIFERIISVINRENLSYSVFYSDDQLSITSSGSISTHESTFDYTTYCIGNNEKEDFKKKELKRENILGKIALERDIQLLSHIHDGSIVFKLQEINSKLDNATKRREFFQRWKKANFKSANTKVSNVCYSIKHNRMNSHKENYAQSFLLRKANEEDVLLRKAYEGFAKKLKEWKREELKVARDKTDNLKERKKTQLKSAAQLFHDHIQTLKKNEVICFDNNKDNSIIVINQKRLRLELTKYNKFVAKGIYSARNSNNHCNSNEKSEKKISKTTLNENIKYNIKSNHYLFSVLSHSTWESSLRDSGKFIEELEEWK